MWEQRSGVFCSIVTGFGKRISLKGINKYPSPEYWENPDKACVCYQESGGRGIFKTVCYSNLYPLEYEGLIEDAINNTLVKMELLTGQKYPRGFNKEAEMDIAAFAAELGAGVVMTTEEHEAALRELMEIAKTQGAKGLKRRKKDMRHLMDEILKRRAESNAADMLRRQFNKKAACADVAIVGAGQFNSFNAEGTEITPVYDFVKNKLEK